MRPSIAFLADDFTGATDVILHATRLSRTATLFVDIPSEERLAAAAEKYEVIGIASVIRALGPDATTPYVERALERLSHIRPRVVQYKICSTGDSSPLRGSIGPAVAAGRERFGHRSIPLLIAQPNLGRHTLFSTHFARDASGTHRLDRNPAMANHPATPMNEADLRRHFTEQIGEPIGEMHLTQLRDGTAPLPSAGVYVIDAVDHEDLQHAGQRILSSAPAEDTVFAIGSGGLSIGLLSQPGEWSAADDAHPPFEMRSSTPAPRSAPVLAVSGSGAPETSRQIDAAADAGWVLIHLDVSGAVRDTDTAIAEQIRSIVARASSLLHDGQSCLVFTTHDLIAPRSHSIDARIVGNALGRVLRGVAEMINLDRAIIAGGDTSGYVLQCLGATRIDAAGSIADELLLATMQSDIDAVSGLEIVLKGGQLGPRDVFEQARVTPGRPLTTL